jgi:hypothetical protein
MWLFAVVLKSSGLAGTSVLLTSMSSESNAGDTERERERERERDDFCKR